MDTKVSMLKLKLKLESLIKQRKELDNRIMSVEKQIEELNNPTDNVETDQEKLFKMIESLPDAETRFFHRDLSYRCSLCFKTFKEGFDDKFQMEIFYMKHPDLKEYSAYCLSHSRFSKCYKNQFCSLCELRGDDYNQFIHKTDRTRHIKKHKDKGEQVRFTKNDKSISELKHMFREQAEKKKRCIVIPKKKEQVVEQEEKEEEDRVNKINEQRQVEFQQQQDIMYNRMYESTLPKDWNEEDEKLFQLLK